MASDGEQAAKARKMKIAAAIGSMSAIVLVGVCAKLAIDGKLDLSGHAKLSDVKNFTGKLEFTVKYWALHGLWFLIAIFNVGKGQSVIQSVRR